MSEGGQIESPSMNADNEFPILPSKIDVKTEEQHFPVEAKASTASSSSAIVASHYNSLPEMGIQRRNDSRILHLRNLNNWMKSMLIGDLIERLNQEGCRKARVLDLACGKGGDLRKWRIGNIGEIVMTDIAEISLQDCRDRYQRLKDRRTGRMPFQAHILQADLTQANLAELLPKNAPANFDLASCQFAVHYSFRTEQCARRMLKNCTEMLRPGGYFIGTVTNADAIMHYLRPNGHFSNQVCSVSVTGDWLEASKSEPPQSVPLFGAEIQFQLEGVVNCPEYLCYFPLLKKILEELGLELVYEYDFPAAIDHYLKERGREAIDLMRRMDALEPVEKDRLEGKDAQEYGPAIAKLQQGGDNDNQRIVMGTLSRSEWEVVTMYKVFAFRKTTGTATSADDKNVASDDCGGPEMKRPKLEENANDSDGIVNTDRERSPLR